MSPLPTGDESLGKEFQLRVQLAPVGNLRGGYADPYGHPPRAPLGDADILETLAAAHRYGVERVHYRGGEPTLRPGLLRYLAHARELGYVEQALTTNGLRLPVLLPRLVDAGLTRVDIDLDSLQRERTIDLTGQDVLDTVLRAVRDSVEAFGAVEVNTLLLRENLDEIADVVAWAAGFGGRLTPRFVELSTDLPGFDAEAARTRAVSAEQALAVLAAEFGQPLPEAGADVIGDRECTYYRLPGSPVRFGLVAAPARPHPCRDHHGLRLGPYGELGTCRGAAVVDVRGVSLARKCDAVRAALTGGDPTAVTSAGAPLGRGLLLRSVPAGGRLP
ncbi:radical SAM protein [Catellatospora tritici]|uniref:radical SAM protein n=1 Tax=Catellatospora tritici TaxID=2851566 RepID=UPI001C2CE146|nr:radical SAM protein [Catellatospora tritici]MBV1855991.1 radical SAM protein [Catellatospora tritici]